jgi:hypothetical protein
MGRELQKKKNRSSIPKVKQKPKSKRHLNPKGNPIIAANWYGAICAVALPGLLLFFLASFYFIDSTSKQHLEGRY